MSVSVEVCKDIEQFQEIVVAGMDAKHTLFAIGGILAGSITGGICHLVLHTNHMITMYAIMFTAIPVIFLGFLDKDGMGIIERIRRSRTIRKAEILYNISTESPETFKQLLEQEKASTAAVTNHTETNSTQEAMKKQLKMLAFAGTGAMLLVIAAVITIMVLK